MKRVILVEEQDLESLRGLLTDPSWLRPQLQRIADGESDAGDALVEIRSRLRYEFDNWKQGA